jgi:ATP-binding cassette subfamily A (ABC1) protein 3
LGFPVYERENKLKYALNVMGCRIFPYWLSTMIFDFILGSIVTTIMIIVLASLKITVLLSFGKIIIFYCTQLAFIGISYSVSWLYTSANMA